MPAHLRYWIFYFAGGFVAMMAQKLTLAFGTAAEGRVSNLGGSGAIASVLGAYFVLYPVSVAWTAPGVTRIKDHILAAY
jgi:membrane associated rhomboid family serine protease